MSTVQDYLINIKSFQMYLDNIVQSIEKNNFHEESIKNLSECISLYYSKINEDVPEDDEDIEFVESDTSVQGNDNNSDEESDTSSDSDSDSDDSNNDSLFFSPKTEPVKETKVTDKYLDEFTSGNVNINDILLYGKYPEAKEKLNNFLCNADVY